MFNNVGNIKENTKIMRRQNKLKFLINRGR